MKKLLLLFVCFFFTATILAQEDIAVFVYSTTSLNESTNALRSRMVSALYNNAGNRYTVVDRSAEFWEIQKMEFGYQERGYVSDKELVAAGMQLGADKVCGVVITFYNKEGYFIECKILDVEKNRLEGQAEYPRVGKGDCYIHDIGIATSQMVAASLAEQLNMGSVGMKEEANKIKAEQDKIEKEKAEKAARQKKAENKEKFLCYLASPSGSLISSAVVPGLGLINKGHSGWGTTFLITEVGMVAGVIITYNKAQNLLTTMKDPLVSADAFTAANTQYSQMKTANHIFIGAAAAIYVTNLVVTVVSKNESKHVCFFSAPVIDKDGNIIPTISLTLNF